MTQKPAFGDQVEQFVEVVRSILMNEETRSEFAKAPLAILDKAGIQFSDPAVRKRVEGELLAGGGGSSALPPDDDSSSWFHWYRLAARACSVTWVARPSGGEEVIQIDQPRVDAFANRAAVDYKLNVLTAKVNKLAQRL